MKEADATAGTKLKALVKSLILNSSLEECLQKFSDQASSGWD